MTYADLPLVSVVIPSYNHAHFLPRALQSVQRQSWTNWEVLVVDNHSTDNTDEVMQAWLGESVRLLKTHNNGVIAVSRNMGVLEARGEWIAFLDSDDWWTDDKLEISMRAALAGADVIYHDLTIVDSDRRPRAWKRSRSRNMPHPAYRDMINNGCPLPNSSVVLRKSRLDAIGGLCKEPELSGWEDFDTWLRLAKSGCRFVRVPGSHGFYWIGGGNVSNPRRTLANIDAFLARYVGNIGNTPWWCHYGRAVAYKALGRQECVGPSFGAAMRAHPGLLNYLRIVFKRLLLS
jgi:glycosyltransferase involved in cell wall biosynthesis